MNNYWKPQFKWQLVQWFVDQGILDRNKANRMSKSQLYGKYCEIRTKMGR